MPQMQKPLQPVAEVSSDPDNVPPRSRLFIVVPKQSEAQKIQVRGVGVLMGLACWLGFCACGVQARGLAYGKVHLSSSARLNLLLLHTPMLPAG